ncbi:MAG TPA: major capsid protein [Caulobacteraceae bacterium]|nr:major capsid protein [Caulobacteraceae bacterium]
MVSLDIFHQDPFSTIQLTEAVEKVPFQPTLLGDMGIFEPEPIRTTALMVEERTGILTLIKTSERGTPQNSERITEKRTARYFAVPRITQGDTIYANEIQNIRAFGTETELMQVQAEAARRLSGPTGLLANVAYTWENMRLGAVQGVLLDADGSQIYSWFDEFQITAATEVGFNLAAGVANSIRPLCNQIVRAMARASQGAFRPTTRVIALCGDTFYDEFVNHPDVIRTFLNWAAAEDIRTGGTGGAFSSFRFAEIDWINYRGSDDNSTVALPVDRVKFFPVGAPGVFKKAIAPADRFEYVNTLGKDVYVYPIFDRDRNEWWRQEVYSYPLFICTRPAVLQSGRAGT